MTTAPPIEKELRTLDELRFWHRVHWRLTLLYAVAVFAVLGAMGGIVYHYGVQSELETLQSRTLATVTTLSHTLDADAIDAQLRTGEDMQRPYYQEVMRKLGAVCDENPGVEAIYVMRPTEREGHLIMAVDFSTKQDHVHVGTPYDATDIPKLVEGLKKPVAEDEPYADEYGVTISGYAPLRTQDGRTVGVIGMDINAKSLKAIQDRVFHFTLLAFGAAAVLLAIAALIAGRLLRRPLGRVMEAADALASGLLDTRVSLQRSDELGLLGQHFNHMATGLKDREFIRETFGRYVSQDVADTLLANDNALELGGEERLVTVLFSDLRGYSTLSEVLEPKQIVAFLNDYLGEMNTIIDHHQGCVIEYLGDAILAVFNAPNPLPNHAAAAVQCAIDMRDRLRELNTEWRDSGRANVWLEHGLEEIAQRIGVHTGTVIAGNLGSHTRMKYAIIGDNVNIAARLEQMNKQLDTEILVSDDAHERLDTPLKQRARDLGEHTVKGREQAVHVYAF